MLWIEKPVFLRRFWLGVLSTRPIIFWSQEKFRFSKLIEFTNPWMAVLYVATRQIQACLVFLHADVWKIPAKPF